MSLYVNAEGDRYAVLCDTCYRCEVTPTPTGRSLADGWSTHWDDRQRRDTCPEHRGLLPPPYDGSDEATNLRLRARFGLTGSVLPDVEGL